jgi:hypothetical protein
VSKRSPFRDCRGRLSVLRIVGFLLLIGWLVQLLRSLLQLCKLVCRDRKQPGTPNVPPWAYRQPDPLIYSQRYLHAQGLAVTRIAIPAALVEIVIGAPVRPSPLWSRAWQWSTFARHAQRVRSSLPLCGGGASARGPRDSCWRRREVIKEQ